MNKNENFRVSGKITKLLGRDSVADSVSALFEIIKNAHDADALQVSVKFQDFNKNNGKIIIKEKKGDGMTYNDIKNKFLVIGTYSKDSKTRKTRITKRFNRTMLGQKGVGRFALEKLGKEVSIISKPYNSFQKHELKINWDEFEHEEITVDQIPLEIKTNQRTDKYDSGLEITISKIRDDWSAYKIKKLIEHLKKFVLPKELQPPNSFNIEIDAESFGIKKHNLEPELSKKSFFTLIARLENGKLSYIAEKLGKEYIRDDDVKGFRSYFTDDFKRISDLECGDVKLYVYYFPIFRKNDKLHEYYFDKAIEYYSKEFYSQLIKSFPNNFGVKIYRGGLREFKYGDIGFDWTQRGIISRRYAGTVQETKMIGFCILGKNNDKIMTTTNRTEAIDNNAFKDLQDIVITTMMKLDRKITNDRTKLLKEYNTKKQENEEKLRKYQLKTMDDKYTHVDSEFRENLQNVIRTIEEINKDDESVLTVSEIEYTHVALGHFISKLYHDFVAPSTQIFEDSIAKMDSHVKGIKQKSPDELEKIVERLGRKWNQIKIMFNALENIEYGMGVENYYKKERKTLFPRKIITDIFDELIFMMNFKNIALYNEIDPKLKIWTYSPIFYSVMYNLISNALKILNLSDSSSIDKKLLITTKKNGRWLDIFVADNSLTPIKPDRWDVVFEPWISTTSGLQKFNGKGIGLAICKEILKFVRGHIEIIDPILDAGTTFVVKFPIGVVNHDDK